MLLPFHLDSTQGIECTDDLTHDWGPMHLCWNDGKMDSWVKVHTSSTYEGAHGAMTMGYYSARTCRSTTRSRTRSRCATPTTARSWGRRTPTG